jgi:hypothetical protein
MAGRRALSAVAAVAIAVSLAGCAGAARGDVGSAVQDGSTKAIAPTSKAADKPHDTAAGNASPGISPAPTLPPGDPGPDAPGTDDPNGDLGNQDDPPDSNAAKTSVPPSALVDAETVAAVAGGSWTAGVVPGDSCTAPRPAKAVATRSSQLRSQDATGGWIVETVGTHHGVDAAVAAVHALERRLTRCHATSAPDPRIGDASVQLTLTAADGTVTVVTAAAVEGVTFVLSGSGPVTAADRWSALTDIALGSTCVAATDGCH